MNKGLNKKTQERLKEYFNSNDVNRTKQKDSNDRREQRNDKNNVLWQPSRPNGAR